MAQSGYTPIKLYYSATASNVPLAGDLSNGELAINIVDGKLFYKDNTGTVQTIAYKNTPVSTLAGLGTGVATFLATPSSANLAAALTDETGTGSAVFATSPSLTTPALSAETFSTSASVTAAGTNQGNATALTSDYSVITTVASGTGVILPVATVGRRIIVANKGANTVNIYPAIGGAIDGLATNAAIALPAAGVMTFNAASTTQWYSSYNLYTSATVSSGVTSFNAGTTGLTPSTATTGAITLGGTLAVANGGTGVTTSTGSGNLVLSTSPTVSGPTVSGNLTFSGTGNRVIGDFTNATVTNRAAFQTSTTNSTTGVYALPNGTAVGASWQATNNSDPTNCSKVLIATNGSTDVQLVSGINGTGTYLPLSFYTNNIQNAQLDTSGNFTAKGSIGYPTGTGGSVTQLTSKSTGVTLNTICGQIITSNATLGSGGEVSFTLTNSKIAATDVVVTNIASGATTNTYQITVDAVAAGSCRIFLRNSSGSSRSEALTINFAIIKAVNA